MSEHSAVLVMSYGTPRDLTQIADYYTHIRHGRPPPPDLLDELTDRYKAIGGRSPLLDITAAQARGIEERLDGVTAYVGYKHCAPFIEDAVAQMSAADTAAAVGIVMAPHYSAMSIGEYASRARRAAEAVGWRGRLEVVKCWHLEPSYISLLADRVQSALASLPDDARSGAVVIFSAHSLPEQILQADDPYPRQLRETATEVAASAGLTRWEIAWQSAGRTDAVWLGPDLSDVVRNEAERGATAVVVCPCGFVSDHLEVLYDVDIEARAAADGVGVPLVRTASPNADPQFLDTIAGVVQRTLRAVHVASR